MGVYEKGVCGGWDGPQELIRMAQVDPGPLGQKDPETLSAKPMGSGMGDFLGGSIGHALLKIWERKLLHCLFAHP